MMNVLRRRAYLFRDYYQSARVTKYIHQHCAMEAKEVIRQADLLLNNTIVFTDRWDMEPCNTPYTVSLDNWVTSPNGDPEWVYMLNRHDFLLKLWQAYQLTGQQIYTDKIKDFLLGWIAKNPVTQQGTEATRTIDTGIRCMNWSIVLLHLLGNDLLSDDDAELVLDSLGLQCTNMQSRYIGKYALSNWGVLQTTAICAANIWFPEYVSKETADWAWEELQRELSLQILPDGSHWEQSPMYHVEVLNTSAKLLAQVKAVKDMGLMLPPAAEAAIRLEKPWTSKLEAKAGPGEGFDPTQDGWLAQAVRVLSRHVLYSSDPSLFQLPAGDSDVTDVSDVLARAAVLLEGSGIYRFGTGRYMDADSAFLLGARGIERFHSVKPMTPKQTVWNCPDSGNIYYRSDWSKDASFTALKCGTLGSSHGHADQTHISLYYQGQPFLIDSGRYTYLEEDPLRPLLKKPCAHNVCVIDGQSGGEPNGSWSYHRYDETFKNYYSHKDNAHYAEMGFYGKFTDGTPYQVIRKLLTLDCGIWLSSQNVICEGEHQVKEYFHLHGDCVVDNHGSYMTISHGDAALNISSSETTEFRFGIVSEKYNEKRYAPILVKKEQMRDRMTTYTVIADAAYQVNPVPVYQMRREEPVSQEVAAAWDVIKPDGKKYTLILWNRETCRGDKLYTCNGVSVYGKAIVLDWKGDNCRAIRLRV